MDFIRILAVGVVGIAVVILLAIVIAILLFFSAPIWAVFIAILNPNVVALSLLVGVL